MMLVNVFAKTSDTCDSMQVHFDLMWLCDLHKTQYLISEASETLYFLINMQQMQAAAYMTPSAFFSGTIPSRENNCTDAVIVSQQMLHFAHAHCSAASLLLLEAFWAESVVKMQDKYT